MFFPEAMTEVELIVPEKDLLAVTKVLAGQGIFHQVDASHYSARDSQTSSDSWKDRAAAYAGLERRITAMMQTLSLDEGTPPAGSQTTMVELDSVRPTIEEIEQAVKDATVELTSSQKAVTHCTFLRCQM